VDEANHRILLYFHSMVGADQKSALALSTDGLSFDPVPGAQLAPAPDILGDFYFRVFAYGGYHYAFAKNVNIGGELLRSRDGMTPFEKGPEFLPQTRHTAVCLRGDRLYLFYSRAGDAPERLLVSTFSLQGDWKSWKPSEPAELLRPEKDYEGARLKIAPSGWGEATDPVNQLRDPAIFEEGGKVYLFYSIAGEQGIAAAELKGIEAPTAAAALPPPRKWVAMPLFPWSVMGVKGVMGAMDRTLDGRKHPVAAPRLPQALPMQ
jgi:hypothetical protein